MNEIRVTPKVFVGRELRRAREAKGLSRARVAKMLIVSESLVVKWERGDLIPLEDHLMGDPDQQRPGLRDILDLPDMLLRMIDQLVLNDEGSEWNHWPTIEHEASAFWNFQPCVIPGMFQTEGYARATLEAAGVTKDELEGKLAARLKRQEILTKEDPPTYVALISESVLRHMVGDAGVMREQLEHLEQMAQQSNIVVHIVPDNVSACAGFIGGFVIASVSGEDKAFAENQVRGSIMKSAEDIAKLRRYFDIFRGDALDKQGSLEVIRKAEELWKT